MSDLLEKKCIPCSGIIPPLTPNEITNFKAKINNDWKVIENHHIHRDFTFENFIEALNFTNKIGEIAEKEGHHPDIYLAWGKVGVTIWTHKINGLTESDFILAAKIDHIENKQ